MAIQSRWFLITKSLTQILLLVLVIIAACENSLVAQDAVTNKKVLMLFGDDSFIATQVAIERALRSTLKNGLSVPVEG